MFGLPSTTLEALKQVFSSYLEIDQVIIYGSRAKGNFRPGSDIDLTLKGKNLTDSVLSRILVDLDDLNMPYLLDVSIYDEIKSVELIDHIKRAGKKLYSRKS
jgi:predicted nucleotidyltransferase